MKLSKLNFSFIVLALISIVIDAKSQSDKPVTLSSFNYGFFVTANFSSLNTLSSAVSSNYTTTKNGGVTAFGFGIVADYNFKKNYNLTTGISVISGGGSVKIMSTDDNNRSTNELKSGVVSYKIQQIEVPLGLKIFTKINSVADLKIYAEMGMQAGITIGKKAKYSAMNIYGVSATNTSSDAYERISGLSIPPLMIGMNVGIGGIYKLSDDFSALVGFRFSNYFLPDATLPENGLTYSKISGQEVKFNDGKQRYNGFQLRLGLMF